MKRLTGLFLICLFIILTACGTEPKVGEAAEMTVNTREGAVMSVKPDTVRQYEAVVVIENETDDEFYSGNEWDFGLQIEQDGVWHWLQTKEGEYANTSEALIFTNDTPRELTISWGSRYGAISEGHYRIVKGFFTSGEAGGIKENFTLAAEFWIE